MAILYSGFSGTYAFDSSFKLLEDRLFRQELIVEKCLALERNEWLPEERELLARYGKEKVLFLGFKLEPVEGVVFTQDLAKLEKASRIVSNELSLKIAKKKLKEMPPEDWLISQSSNLIEDLNKATNLLSKRLREIYSIHNPEFSRAIEDHEKFAEAVAESSRHELLRQIGLDESLSMGSEISMADKAAIKLLASEIKSLFILREAEKEYLEKAMEIHCPNVKAVAGSLIGAKLFALAGTLKRLSEMPASTIQILGAEKALFRHLKTGARAPKYGVLFNHPLIQTSRKENWGKIGRALADKIAIASKVDYFKGNFVGDKLYSGLERRFK